MIRMALQNFPKPTTPLAVGLFVEAEIEGRMVDNIFRSAALGAAQRRCRADRRCREPAAAAPKSKCCARISQSVLISSGLEPGDRVCVSPVEAFVDGLLVKLVIDGVIEGAPENSPTDQLAQQK